RELGLDPQTVTMVDLKKEEYAEKVAKMVFVTATDGNHGKGISWAAGLLGCDSYVYMPKGSVEVRAQAIRDAGTAEVTITDMSYDDTVRFVADLAERNGWYLMQDTSKDEGDEVPKWIVQGYLTMVYEALEQMETLGFDRPTHVFLQAGVGSMAGGVAGALACTYGAEKPVIIIVEPDEVACIFESARLDDGLAHPSCGTEQTMMAGLNCAEPCETVWPILRDFCECYITCPDDVTAYGMKLLAHPVGKDAPVVSGESGAVTTGLGAMILGDPALADLKAKLGFDENSVILTFSTEGDTDPENYDNIVNK
ncbi:MAG: diaminopropionate ammonia-lyase, partial [Firmicutes bacterium]|nr:diaminopropionate ammonia-lyase [Bacillota bacterium]